MKRDLLHLLKLALWIPFHIVVLIVFILCLLISILFWVCDCETLADYTMSPAGWLLDRFDILP